MLVTTLSALLRALQAPRTLQLALPPLPPSNSLSHSLHLPCLHHFAAGKTKILDNIRR